MPQCVQQLDAVCRDGPPFAPDGKTIAIQLHFQPVAEADEGVTGQPLTAFDALQQKAGRKGRKLHERRNRRIEVTRYVEGRFQRRDSLSVGQMQKTHLGFTGDGFFAQKKLGLKAAKWALSVRRCATTRSKRK